MTSSHSPSAGLTTGFYPFWFWNGCLSEDEVRRQVSEMKAQGIRGFFIHSRQGLAVPYLSETFMDMVAVAIEAAEQEGMVVNLYDEYPYPSGVAGGEVVQGHPRHWATRLCQTVSDVPGGPTRLRLTRGAVLGCAAYPVREGRVAWEAGRDLRSHVGTELVDESYEETGLTSYNRKRYFASRPVPTLEVTLADEPHRIFVSVQAVVDNHKYWQQFADVMDPETVSRFLELTHARYHERFGDRFGGTIRMTFVDETAPLWSTRLPDLYREATGRELAPLLPALQDATHPEHDQVTRELHDLQYRVFCDSFERQMAGWCAAHGILYAGEKTSWRLSQLRYMDVPGCDPGHTKAGAVPDVLQPTTRGNARATASAAYLYGKEGALCECYHSLGWSATLQDAKLLAELLLLMGIRYLVPHGFFYTTHALAKHDAPPSFFFQMPYWPMFGRLSARVEAIGRRFEGTWIDADVLVIDPWSGQPSGAQIEAYGRLLAALAAEHVDFLVVDTDVLEAGVVEGGTVRVRDVCAGVVVQPAMHYVEPPLRAWLEAFEARDGRVLRPTEGADVESLSALLRDEGRARTRVRTTGGAGDRVYAVCRTDGVRRLWLMVNSSRETAQMELNAGAVLSAVPLDDVAAALTPLDGGVYAVTLGPLESVLLETTECAPAAEPVPLVLFELAGPATVRPLDPNLLRMYEWDLALVADDGSVGREARVSAVPLMNQLEQGRFSFGPRVERGFGVMPSLDLPLLDLRYRFSFENGYTGGDVTLVMEPGSIGGEWAARLNDGEPLTAEALAPVQAHVRGSLGVGIGAQLRQGSNTLEVRVRTDRMDGGLRNPLYLAGDFGVSLDPLGLCPRGLSGDFESYRENGLPFYAGVVEYERRCGGVDVPEAGDVRVRFEVPAGFDEACTIAINDGPWCDLPWAPRELRVPALALRSDANRVRCRVHTSLIRSFEGTWFDAAEHRHRDVADEPGGGA